MKKEAQGAFKLEDLVSDVKDDIHPKPFVEGKHLDRWLPAIHKWLEWKTERAPALFRSAKFPEIWDVEAKILIMRITGREVQAVLDESRLLCNHTVVVSVPWHSFTGIRNRSIKISTRYRDEKPQRPDLPRREELEETSRRIAIKFLIGVMNSAVAYDFLQSNRRSNTDLYPNDWKKLPIPDVPPEQQAPVIALVDKILAAKRKGLERKVARLEKKLDKTVSALYGIEDEE